MNTFLKFPFYAKAALVIIGLYVFISVLYIGRDIILPVLYAIIVAIALSPMLNFLVRKKLNRGVSIGLVMLIAILMFASLITLIVSQASMLSEAWPHLTDKFEELLKQTVTWTSGYFDISARKINAWITVQRIEFLNNSSARIGTTLSTMGGILAATFLTPVYICMILFYHPHLVQFIHKLFGVSNDNNVSEVLAQTKTIIQSYLAGLFIEFTIVASLNSIGLLILGIDYAILLGVMGALLNIIPYIGGIIGVAIFMVVALLTKAPIYVLYVFVLYTVIQFIDNNYIVPKIVGSKVKLNALVSIIAVISGGALWGLPGMFLSIPLIAIIKLVFDRIEPLKPWGFLMGETVSITESPKFNFTIKGFMHRTPLKKP